MTFVVIGLALFVGAMLATTVLGGITVIALLSLFQTAKEQLSTAVSQQRNAEERLATAEAASTAVARAIESNSLPWFPKTDKLEARYENEAIDKMENPSFYADVVEGLGGTR